MARNLSSDDLPLKGVDTTHPDIAAAKAISREALVEGLGLDSAEAGAHVKKIPNVPALGKLDTRVSTNAQTGLPGGNETLPSADPENVVGGQESNQRAWENRLKATSLIVKRGGRS